MNSERSERREWRLMVAVGLGRQLSKAEGREVDDAWRAYREIGAARYCGRYPRDFIEQFGAQERDA